MNNIRTLIRMARANPRLALAAATGDVIIAAGTTLLILAITGNLWNW